MDAQTFMTRDPLTIQPDCSCGEALRMMDDEGIRHLPVVQDGVLMGIVSDRELFSRTGWRILGAYDAGETPLAVSGVMVKSVVSVKPEDQVLSVLLELMVSEVGCLPVLKGDKLVGIITEMDMLALYFSRARAHASAGEPDVTVGEVSSKSIAILEPTATLEQADELCHLKGFHHVPVMEDGELLGILSDRDLRRAGGAGISSQSPVEDLMSQDVVTVNEDEMVATAAELMHEYKISSVLVERGGITGILTIKDVLEQGMSVLRGK